MPENTQIKLFEEKKVRSVWDEEEQQWYFSVIDVVEVLIPGAGLEVGTGQQNGLTHIGDDVGVDDGAANRTLDVEHVVGHRSGSVVHQIQTLAGQSGIPGQGGGVIAVLIVQVIAVRLGIVVAGGAVPDLVR